MSFKKVNEVEKNKIEIEFSIEKDAFDAQTAKVFRKKAAKMTIPGFRKGKAPRSIIEKMYGKGVFYEDAINDLLPDAYADALKESGAEVVSRPEFEVVTIDDDGVLMKAAVYTKPEVEIKDYTGIEAEKIVTDVTDEMVNDEINRVRERNARLIDITDRAAELGDTVKIDFDGYVDDKQFEGGKGEDYSLKLGSGTFIPGFEDQIVGHSTNDSFDVNVTFPEDYGHKELAGKPAVFKVVLHSIQFSELPELDDDFAVDVSDFDTLDEYKADVKAKIAEKYENSANNAVEGQIIDGLLKNLTVDIPDCMIDSETENLIRERDYSLRSQGLDLNTYLNIVLRKTVDFVKSKAVITEKNAEEAEKETKPKPKTAKTSKTEKKEDAENAEKPVKPRKPRKTKAEKEAEEAAKAEKSTEESK